MIIDKLGIDWKLLLFQIANFLILLFILRKVLYKPLLGFLDKRRKKIEEGLNKAEKFEEEWQKIKAKEKEIMTQAEKSALQLAEKARLDAQVREKEMTEEARQKAEKIMEEAKKEVAKEKEKVLSELKGETADFIVLATEKILQRSLNDKDEKAMIEKTIRLLAKNEE
jgi:F-type H+-transporting ATPase subunit b